MSLRSYNVTIRRMQPASKSHAAAAASPMSDDRNERPIQDDFTTTGPLKGIQQLLSTFSTTWGGIIEDPTSDSEDCAYHNENDNSIPLQANNERDEILDQALQELLGDEFVKNKFQQCLENNQTDESFVRMRACHMHQQEVWDCGIACLLIILRWIRQDSIGNSESHEEKLSTDEIQERQYLLDAVGTQSIWTPDLVLQLDVLLKQEGRGRYLFCSKTFEVVKDYQQVGYYRAAFGSDEERVTRIFEQFATSDIKSHMVRMEQGVPLPQILDAVCHPNCIALVLVDNAILSNSGKDSKGETSYIGHYVILCGISQNEEEINMARSLDKAEEATFCLVISNPAFYQPSLSFVLSSRFESARRAWGTDEDIIFLSE